MPIDLNTLNELKEIMEDDFDELISIFITDGQTQIEELKLAISSSSVEEVRRIAHTLKGSGANLGIISLSESCRLLEYSAAENSLDNTDDLLVQIIKNFEEAKTVLEENYRS